MITFLLDKYLTKYRYGATIVYRARAHNITALRHSERKQKIVMQVRNHFMSVVKAGILSGVLFFASATVSQAQDDIVDTAVKAGSFKTLVAAVKAAGLVETLKGTGPFTVFAPSDEAFDKLPKKTIESLLKPENKAKLTAILTYHVVPGKVMAADVMKLKNGTKVKTVNGKSVKIRNKHGVAVNSSKVVKTDIECSNGVIHVIDKVLLPK